MGVTIIGQDCLGMVAKVPQSVLLQLNVLNGFSKDCPVARWHHCTVFRRSGLESQKGWN
jgi:hypothetical protein